MVRKWNVFFFSRNNDHNHSFSFTWMGVSCFFFIMNSIFFRLISYFVFSLIAIEWFIFVHFYIPVFRSQWNKCISHRYIRVSFRFVSFLFFSSLCYILSVSSEFGLTRFASSVRPAVRPPNRAFFPSHFCAKPVALACPLGPPDDRVSFM